MLDVLIPTVRLVFNFDNAGFIGFMYVPIGTPLFITRAFDLMVFCLLIGFLSGKEFSADNGVDTAIMPMP